jgi:alpha-amylase
VFYRDYSQDKNCFGLKPSIDRLIWIHEHLAAGPSLQRFKDPGVFAFERMGGSHLLVGLNKDGNNARTIDVQTGFPAHTQLRDFTGHENNITTSANSTVRLTIPKNTNGHGYVCYSIDRPVAPFAPKPIATTQDYEGAADLDIKPALNSERVLVSRIFVAQNTPIQAHMSFDTAHWTANTAIQLVLEDPSGATAASATLHQSSAQGSGFREQAHKRGFYSLFVQSSNTPAQNSAPAYRLRLTYTAPQIL